MTPTLFITGTDTGCGKTTVTAALARRLAEGGQRVACFKPVASGCEWIEGAWRNEDALALMAAASVELDYDQVNPIALEEAIAPHLAAERSGVAIDLDALVAGIEAPSADIKLVEGAGGWMVPLGDGLMTADLARRLDAGVVLVVGLKLGAINHALLSARAIEADGLKLVGWIANRLDPDQPVQDENIATLGSKLGPPLAVWKHDGGWEDDGRLAEGLFGGAGSALLAQP